MPTGPNAELLTVLVLTRNECLHIKRCIESARQLATHVYVVDSRSSDGTATIAAELGATVLHVDFDRFSDKFNWCLSDVDFPTPWVMRLDADEVLTPALVQALPTLLEKAPANVSGLYLRRQLWFMGQWVRRGGMFPTYSLRIWRKGLMRCEVRDLDEHMILTTGHAMHAGLDIIDNPLYDLSTWIDKHNRYAGLEAKTEIECRAGLSADAHIRPRLLGTWAERHRWLKLHVFYRLPLFVRPFAYFFFRYVMLLGFLDGRRGFLFHFLHGLWYRMLVDGKIMEHMRRQGRKD